MWVLRTCPSGVSDEVLMGRVAERGTDRFGPDLTDPRMIFGTKTGGVSELADHVTRADRARHHHPRAHATELQFLATSLLTKRCARSEQLDWAGCSVEAVCFLP